VFFSISLAHTSARICAFACIILAAGCAGSGANGGMIPDSSVPAAPDASAPQSYPQDGPVPQATDTSPPAGTESKTTASATTAAFALKQLGGLQGDKFVAHKTGDTYEYSENVVLVFTKPVNVASFKSTYSLKPQTPVSVSGWGNDVTLTMRKVPGQVYTISLPATLRAADGSSLGAATAVSIKTPSTVTVVSPIKSTRGQAYRYGALVSAFTGVNAPQIVIPALASAGVRFVRTDYSGGAIEPKSGTFTFIGQDAILSQLAAKGITELPVLTQYGAPIWATGGRPYPAIWESPTTFAAFAGAVAKHLASKYPQVARIELFNEPNLSGWWNNANPAYAKNDGSSAAAYMKAAYAAIKHAAPHMMVVGPGAANGGPHVSLATFFNNLYANGCRTGVCWDEISLHNYRPDNPTFYVNPKNDDQWNCYKVAQAVAAAHGNGTPHILMTEAGFSHSTTDPTGLDPRVQAQYIALEFNKMLADPTVDGVVYNTVYNPGTTYWATLALTNPNLSPLPAESVYSSFAKF
jgi:hypothetical protein